MVWIRTTWAVLWSARSSAPAEDQSDVAPSRNALLCCFVYSPPLATPLTSAVGLVPSASRPQAVVAAVAGLESEVTLMPTLPR